MHYSFSVCVYLAFAVINSTESSMMCALKKKTCVCVCVLPHVRNADSRALCVRFFLLLVAMCVDFVGFCCVSFGLSTRYCAIISQIWHR